MRISRSATYALGVMAAAALLAGCNGSGSQVSGVTPVSGAGATRVASPLSHKLDPSATFLGVKWAGNVRPDRHKSWISPDVRRAPRLYFASDAGSDDVYIYTMPDMALKGTLTGFDEPQGECSDTKGNIYVVNTSGLDVLKYSRTGTLLATYNVPQSSVTAYPAGCAVNPTNGDLAVTIIVKVTGTSVLEPGEVLIYTSPSSTPTAVSNPSQAKYYFAGYDSGGDLWVDGETALTSGTFILSYCGATSCSTIPLTGGTIYFPGAVEWDNVRSTWVVFDQSCNDAETACSYPVSGSGALGTATAYSNATGSGTSCDVIQAVIAANGKNYVAGGNFVAGSPCTGSTTATRWGYPAGGTPTNFATGSLEPIGAAVSTK